MLAKQRTKAMTRFFIFVVSLVLISCSSMPALDTLNKRVAAFEISFQEIVKVVILYKEEGRLSENDFLKAKGLVNEINETMVLVNSLKSIDDLVGAETNLQRANALLGTLRNYLREKEINDSSKLNYGFRYYASTNEYSYAYLTSG